MYFDDLNNLKGMDINNIHYNDDFPYEIKKIIEANGTGKKESKKKLSNSWSDDEYDSTDETDSRFYNSNYSDIKSFMMKKSCMLESYKYSPEENCPYCEMGARAEAIIVYDMGGNNCRFRIHYWTGCLTYDSECSLEYLDGFF